MKKFLALFLLLPAVLACDVLACDPSEYTTIREGYWYLKNCTDYKLRIQYYSSCENYYMTDTIRTRWNDKTIVPGDSLSLTLYGNMWVTGIIPEFNHLGMRVDSISIVDMNNEKHLWWYQSDSDSGHRNLFDEENWRDLDTSKHLKWIWVFEITDEDLPPFQEVPLLKIEPQSGLEAYR